MPLARPAKLCCCQSLTVALLLAAISVTANAESPRVRVESPLKVLAPPVKAHKIALHFKRTGGIAGFHDNLTLYTNMTYAKKAPPHRRPKAAHTGKLTAEQQATLKKLLATYGKVEWSRGNAPDVADGMQEAITINGTGQKTKLDPKDPEFGQIMKLASDLLRGAK